MTDIFAQQAAAYDVWYDTQFGQSVFGDERDALHPLLTNLAHPWLEVGVGTGRFAAGLGAEVGVDPSVPSLALAARRRVRVAAAWGEALPFPPRTFGAVLIVTTLCFVADPLAVLMEARRVLRPGGGIVLGIIPADSPWGEHYQMLAAQGHDYYQHAHFFRRQDLGSLLQRAGLQQTRTRSALFWAPRSQPPTDSTATEEDDPMAGFLAVLAIPATDRTNPA